MLAVGIPVSKMDLQHKGNITGGILRMALVIKTSCYGIYYRTHHNIRFLYSKNAAGMRGEGGAGVVVWPSSLPLARDDNIICQPRLHRAGGVDGVEFAGYFDTHDLANRVGAVRLATYLRKKERGRQFGARMTVVERSS